MVLTRRRQYYLLRDLECASCRSKKATRIFIDKERVLGDCEYDSAVATLEVLCINCAHKAPWLRQTEGRKAHIDEALTHMHLREAAKIPTRYDAYRLPTKEPLTPYDVQRIAERIPCEVCGQTDHDLGRENAVLGYLMWPDQRSIKPPYTEIEPMIDTFRDCVWLCDKHKHHAERIKISWSFDENFYNSMSTLYS